MGQKVLGAFVDSRVIEREKLLQDPTSGSLFGKGMSRRQTSNLSPSFHEYPNFNLFDMMYFLHAKYYIPKDFGEKPQLLLIS